MVQEQAGVVCIDRDGSCDFGDCCHKLLEMCRNLAGFWEKLRPLSFERKRQFYQSTWSVARALMIDLGATESDADEGIDWLRKLFRGTKADLADIHREIAAVPSSELANWLKEARESAGPILKEHLEELSEDLSGLPLDRETAAEVGELLERPSIQFVLLIAAPCLLETGKLPDRIVAKNSPMKRFDDNLLALSRIDPDVLHLPEIRAKLHPVDRKERSKQHAWLAKAVKGSVRKTQRKTVRHCLAGLLMGFAERLDVPLGWPEVEELFRIGAVIEGISADYARPIQPATFRDLSNKRKRRWELTSRPDGKSRKAIDAVRKALS